MVGGLGTAFELREEGEERLGDRGSRTRCDAPLDGREREVCEVVIGYTIEDCFRQRYALIGLESVEEELLCDRLE